MRVMKHLFVGALLAFSIYAEEPETTPGGAEGHGGDPIPMLFVEARPVAAKALRAFHSNEQNEVSKFLDREKEELAKDVLESPHKVWEGEIPKRVTKCAYTDLDLRAPIRFYLKLCENRVRSVRDAAKVLVHESVHHVLKKANCAFADEVQFAVFGKYKGSKTPEVVFEESFEKGREGMDFLQASAFCEKQRRLYENEYFFVYCVFHQKNGTDVKIGTSYYVDYRLLGYETIVSNDSIRMWGIAIQDNSALSRPVFRRVYIPYKYSYETHFQIYGLKVMGLGNIDATSPYKVILSSLEINPALDPLTFDSRKEAYLACKKAFLALEPQDAFKYHRARCFVEKEKNAFYYTIKSQNPFL